MALQQRYKHVTSSQASTENGGNDRRTKAVDGTSRKGIIQAILWEETGYD
jgi:hypothetical protein